MGQTRDTLTRGDWINWMNIRREWRSEITGIKTVAAAVDPITEAGVEDDIMEATVAEVVIGVEVVDTRGEAGGRQWRVVEVEGGVEVIMEGAVVGVAGGEEEGANILFIYKA